VNLAPADLPKESGRFDLPIAIDISPQRNSCRPHRSRATVDQSV